MSVPVVVFTVRGAPPPEGLGRPYTVVYDGTCKVCTRLSNVLRRWDRGKLEVVASQSPGVMARFPWIPARAYAEALQLIGSDGHTWQGSAAIEELLNILPRGRLIAWVFHIPFIRTLADRFYRWFARNRYHLGCGEHCQSRPLNVIFAEAERPASSPSARPAGSSPPRDHERPV
jgi:predicted DCC family thiol-disulfide oxidoreductase YuxK